MMLVLSSPSGAGKTTISKKIQQKHPSFKISVSHTTRKPRPNEVDGIDYHFTTHEDFKKMIDLKMFYEYAEIFGNFYGTSKQSVDEILSKKNDILFDIDWQGNEQLSKYSNLYLTKVFILPPDKDELRNRLQSRNQDNPETIKKRLVEYEKDILKWKEYDYIIINDNLENCISQLDKIIFDTKNKVSL